MKELTWRHVAVITILVAGIVALTITGHDAGALTGLGILIATGIGVIVQQGRQGIEQTNGRIGELVKLVEKQSVMLASMTPVLPTDDKVSVAEAMWDGRPDMTIAGR